MDLISFAGPISNLENAKYKLENSIEILESALKQFQFQVNEALSADFLKNYAENVEIHQHELSDKTKFLIGKIEQTDRTLSKIIVELEKLQAMAEATRLAERRERKERNNKGK